MNHVVEKKALCQTEALQAMQIKDPRQLEIKEDFISLCNSYQLLHLNHHDTKGHAGHLVYPTACKHLGKLTSSSEMYTNFCISAARRPFHQSQWAEVCKRFHQTSSSITKAASMTCIVLNLFCKSHECWLSKLETFCAVTVFIPLVLWMRVVMSFMRLPPKTTTEFTPLVYGMFCVDHYLYQKFISCLSSLEAFAMNTTFSNTSYT